MRLALHEALVDLGKQHIRLFIKEKEVLVI